MADEWFVQRDGQNFGPFSSAQLKQMTTTGRVLPADLVTKGQDGRWVPASQIKGLFATSPAPASQLPPMPPPLPAAASQLPPMPPPLPATAPSSNPTTHLVSPFSDLGSSPRSALWAKILGGVGLAVVFIGLLCPWYKVSSHTSVDTTGMNVPGMDYSSRGGRGGYGMGGAAFPNSGINNAGRKQQSSTSESASGLMSVPGLFALLLTIGIGAMFFLPKRLFVLIATGLACLLLLTILGSFLYVPSVDGAFEFGETGFGASGSVKAGASWGQFVSLIGDLMLLVTGVLILLRVGSTHSTGGSGKIAGELSPA
jgi:hypothetical protein